MKNIVAAVLLAASLGLAGCGDDNAPSGRGTASDESAATAGPQQVGEGGAASTPNVSDPSVSDSSVSDPNVSGIDASAISVEVVAERFVKLALGLGLHDKAYVDAYHGPQNWRDDVEAAAPDLEALRTEALTLIEGARLLDAGDPSPRVAMLEKNLVAALTRIDMARGDVFDFDEETRRLYDAVAPQYDVADFDAALAQLEALLPGEGPLHERADAFRSSLAIPTAKLDAVFSAAIEECRRRTLARYDLPDTERFTTGFVTDKPWGGYNWYQGDFESLIEVNTDLPVIIDRAVDLGCHEGYPGHHTWNVFLEHDLLKDKGWIEYSVYPLFSPQSLIAEGSANYGIELAFPGDEKMIFERDVLFPIAGLDPEDAKRLAAVNSAGKTLTHARNHVARAYLNGDIDRETAITMIQRYGATSRERAQKSVSFIETYRGYVINYNLGRDLVEAYIDARVAAGDDPWAAFKTILTTPTSASDLIAGVKAAGAQESLP